MKEENLRILKRTRVMTIVCGVAVIIYGFIIRDSSTAFFGCIFLTLVSNIDKVLKSERE